MMHFLVAVFLALILFAGLLTYGSISGELIYFLFAFFVIAILFNKIFHM